MHDENVSEPRNAEVTLSVHGMSCEGCENNIQFALTALGGVHSVDARFEANTVDIGFDDKKVSAQELGAAIAAMGYETGVEQ